MTQPASSSSSASQVVTHVTNRIGFIELDRPQALNALSLDMVRAMHAALRRWRDDPDVLAVVVLSRHARAFCAGGDVRFLYESLRNGERHAVDTFFIDEYRLDHAIFTYPKPYIALLNGVVMGGGMGISQGAAHTGGLRVVSASTRMAMPETRIGLFPDVGVCWFLARTPGALGRYLAVTGETVGAADALYAGLADAYVDDAAWPALLEILQTEWFGSGADVVARIRREARQYVVEPAPEASPLARARGLIDPHFAQPDMARILASLEAAQRDEHGQSDQRDGRDQSDENESENGTHDEPKRAWIARTLDVLRERSPLSMAVSLEAVSRAGAASMADCLRRDLDLTRSSFEHGDVMEGIRARLIDKDNQPRWRIAGIGDVHARTLASMFASPWRADQHPLRDLGA